MKHGNARVMLCVAKDTEGGGAEREVSSLCYGQADPARGENGTELPVSEERDVAGEVT